MLSDLAERFEWGPYVIGEPHQPVVIRERTFENCRISGPGIFHPCGDEAGSISHCRFESVDFWELPKRLLPTEPETDYKHPIGIIVLLAATFVDALPQPDVRRYEAGTRGGDVEWPSHNLVSTRCNAPAHRAPPPSGRRSTTLYAASGISRARPSA